jgi:hypothetical protein
MAPICLVCNFMTNAGFEIQFGRMHLHVHERRYKKQFWKNIFFWWKIFFGKIFELFFGKFLGNFWGKNWEKKIEKFSKNIFFKFLFLQQISRTCSCLIPNFISKQSLVIKLHTWQKCTLLIGGTVSQKLALLIQWYSLAVALSINQSILLVKCTGKI